MSWTITPQTKVPVDPFRSQVSLLLHGDGANGSTTITDSSPTPKTVTAVGDAKISTAQSKFGGSSFVFDGTGDYLASNASTAFGMESSNFTLEAWIYPASVGGGLYDRGIVDFRNTSFGQIDGGATFIDRNTAKLSFWDGLTVYGNTGTVVSANTWHHVAFVRAGDTLAAYLNGIQDFAVSFNVNLGSNRPLGVGGSNTDLSKGQSPFIGYIDELRITKGVARYTANFTPPTAPFPDI